MAAHAPHARTSYRRHIARRTDRGRFAIGNPLSAGTLPTVDNYDRNSRMGWEAAPAWSRPAFNMEVTKRR